MGKTSRDPAFKCEGASIPLVEEVELLGVTVDNKSKFESQIKKIYGKVSQQIAFLKRMRITSVHLILLTDLCVMCRFTTFNKLLWIW